jgi:hypothetical protein
MRLRLGIEKKQIFNLVYRYKIWGNVRYTDDPRLESVNQAISKLVTMKSNKT